ncbi:unnamed protein product [Lactuca virosa]|uniref:Epidermal patterning factor-like protein n=1 Tax=Lactuca virosa TaxID=75947 RepID=A0AAU9MZD0_9ASTR|nr:unnamed protein product [Lactuca virosa]
MGLKVSKKSSSFCVFLIVTVCVLLTIPSLVFRSGLGAVIVHDHIHDLSFRGKEEEMIRSTITTMRRRMLSGLGSSPPRCAWKCGRCTPCKPIHVAVPPGKSVTMEYYPEAWRCKCGNNLYMP